MIRLNIGVYSAHQISLLYGKYNNIFSIVSFFAPLRWPSKLDGNETITKNAEK